MISAEALAALSGLEHGANYNSTHTIARELMAAGYACDSWGHLNLTEAGRIYLRRGQFRIAITSDDQVCDLSVQHHVDRGDYDPMAAPHRAQKAPSKPLELVPEAPPEPLPVAETRMQEMLRAAGVASGKTGIWPDEQWVLEFVKALDGVFSGVKTDTENTL